MDTSKIMDVFAYFLSEYDDMAVNALGYSTRKEAFKVIANKFGKKETYVKRLRDEYDVVTSSKRNGQCNRPPRQRIIKTKEYLCKFNFDELLDITRALLENTDVDASTLDYDIKEYDVREMSEEEIENLINFKDASATVKRIVTTTKQRLYNTTIITQLKKLYKGKCQICGEQPFGADICEIHHIQYYSLSKNNDSSNLLLLCPNHHRMIHKYNPRFNRQTLSFVFDNRKEEKITLNLHLSGE